MGQTIYLTDPAVAATYRVHPGEFVYVADKAEAAWLLAQRHGYSLAHPRPLPAAYYVHPNAPKPFAPYPGPAPAPAPTPSPSPSPSPATATAAQPTPPTATPGASA